MRFNQWLRGRLPHLPEAAVGLSCEGIRYRLAWIGARRRAERLRVQLLRRDRELRAMIERLRARRRSFQAEAYDADQHDAHDDVTLNHLLAYELQIVADGLEELECLRA